MNLVSDSESNGEILWAFHEENVKNIETTNERLLGMLGPGIGRGRVSLYNGIDCRTLFSQIYNRLRPNYLDLSGSAIPSRVITSAKEKYSEATRSRELLIKFEVPIPPQISAISDRPLFVEPWVGRDQELSILSSLTVPVAFITGLGGQGKSALAGRFLKQQATNAVGRFEIWDWRDCREESDRLLRKYFVS